MREEKIWFWKVFKDPVWGTHVSRARMTEEEARKAYKGLHIERVDASLMVIQQAETPEEIAERWPGFRQRKDEAG